MTAWGGPAGAWLGVRGCSKRASFACVGKVARNPDPGRDVDQNFLEERWCAPVLAQAVERVRATPGFAAAAARAKQAYQTQMVQAAEAVRNFAADHDLDPGEQLTWRTRPEVSKVGQHLCPTCAGQASLLALLLISWGARASSMYLHASEWRSCCKGAVATLSSVLLQWSLSGVSWHEIAGYVEVPLMDCRCT